MCIVNIGIATVVVDSQIIAVILEDTACMSRIAAANKVCYMAACKACQSVLAIYLVSPFSTVCQPQVEAAMFFTISRFVHAAASPNAICALQRQIDARFLILSIDITSEFNNIVACIVILDIDVDNAGAIGLQCIVCFCLGILFDFQIAVHVDNASAASIDTIAFLITGSGNCSICINGNSGAYLSENTLTFTVHSFSIKI